MTVTLNIYVACVIQKTKTIRFVIKLPRECYALCLSRQIKKTCRLYMQNMILKQLNYDKNQIVIVEHQCRRQILGI
jgi:hypothetical protein